MNFAPKNEKQLLEERLIPKGVYPFTVTVAASKLSKAGNEMIELTLRIFMPDGSSRVVKDYLMEKMAFKLFHFCSYTGLARAYEQGTLKAEDCLNREGYALIEIQEDKKKEFPPRNGVADYARAGAPEMKRDGVLPGRPQPTEDQLANIAPKEDALLEDDVPFN